uniref:SapB_2 domain-containing protein n=1 Tax=Caenorhabditis japonica TaxID=281687 RepID=A0A8R1E0N9_CAEJA
MKAVLCIVALTAIASAYVLPHQQDSLRKFVTFVSTTQSYQKSSKLIVSQSSQMDEIQTLDRNYERLFKEFITECKDVLSGVPFLEQECTNYAHKELDPIIKELASGTAPNDVCNKLNECP